ncbi:DUF4350 domain-containing protein [Microbacterium sp. NPDC055683]
MTTSASAPAHRRRRTAAGWLAIVAGFVVFGLVLVALASREWTPRDAFDPEGPGPDGSLALATLLAERGGIRVVVAEGLDAALAAGDGTTLVLGSTAPLADDDVEALAASGADVVLLAPTSRDLRLLFGSSYAAYGTGAAVAPSCDVDAAVPAGDVAPGETYTRGDAADACYPVGEGYGLLRVQTDGGSITALDAAALLVNERLAEDGAAALGLGLLGAHDEVVWFLPGLDDATVTSAPDLGDLTPGWVTPVLVLAALTAVAAGLWRGRRFGPLVAEDLPVTVRANETLEGRARLYARAADAHHAAALLRAGASERMAVRLGLARHAGPRDVADAAATRLGAPRETVRAILLADPASDADLVASGERLRDLEAAVDAAVRTERKRP